MRAKNSFKKQILKFTIQDNIITSFNQIMPFTDDPIIQCATIRQSVYTVFVRTAAWTLSRAAAVEPE